MDRNQKQAWGWILALVAVVAIVWAGFAWLGDNEYTDTAGVGEVGELETNDGIYENEGIYEDNETFGEGEVIEEDEFGMDEEEEGLGEVDPFEEDEEGVIGEEEEGLAE